MRWQKVCGICRLPVAWESAYCAAGHLTDVFGLCAVCERVLGLNVFQGMIDSDGRPGFETETELFCADHAPPRPPPT